ncbi:hypothetical protein FEM48_Zijuj09G0190700 [Ziziphus jujuba var. spinosa]|uniref:Uncharacterized protein n=1 Tax=Ziziphus jujuba var. spinosa TaxID=714518 RepID=A0A978UUS2_ZIZJJ|nr:hypothetical protein FEM48_Zijuj09G0190700 [Ziziphus jujuba var. spinosa]
MFLFFLHAVLSRPVVVVDQVEEEDGQQEEHQLLVIDSVCKDHVAMDYDVRILDAALSMSKDNRFVDDWELKFEAASRVSIEELERVNVEDCLKGEAGCCSVCFEDFKAGCEATQCLARISFMEIV